ncbi:MAG: PQQ-binding-like beta-propeller repeat protein [Egibacteraceae bacterium]
MRTTETTKTGPLRAEGPVREPGYAAFISYSHAADGRLAPAVQRGLERLAKPWYRRRALRVFRDDSGLAVTPALWSTIVAALDSSDYLVLLASPEAARSEWVGREVEHWTATKPVERILLVVTDGELHWDDNVSDFDQGSTALPPSLPGVFSEAPRWLDLSWAHKETQLDLRHSRFRDAIAQLAAPIHGRAKDDLEAEDINLHRRALRQAWSAVVMLVVLALVASLGWNSAVSNERTARARELAARATTYFDQHPLSLLLSLESLRVSRTDEARDTLLRGLLDPRHNAVALRAHTGSVRDVAFSPDGTTIATASEDQTVRLWSPAAGEQIGQPLIGHAGPVLSVTFNPDGRTIATGGEDGAVRLWNAATGQPVGPPLTGHAYAVPVVAFSPDGKVLASGGEDGVRLWNTATGQPIGQPVPLLTGNTLLWQIAFSSDSSMIAFSRGLAVELRDAYTGQPLGQPLTGHTDSVRGVAFSPDGSMIASSSDDQTVLLWDIATGQRIGQPLTGHSSEVWDVAFKPDGTTIASAGEDGTVRLWDTAEIQSGVQSVGRPLIGHTDGVWAVAFSRTGRGLPPRAMTRRCGCGTPQPANRLANL